jgi:hypothetical protein
LRRGGEEERKRGEEERKRGRGREEEKKRGEEERRRGGDELSCLPPNLPFLLSSFPPLLDPTSLSTQA